MYTYYATVSLLLAAVVELLCQQPMRNWWKDAFPQEKQPSGRE